MMVEPARGLGSPRSMPPARARPRRQRLTPRGRWWDRTCHAPTHWDLREVSSTARARPEKQHDRRSWAKRSLDLRRPGGEGGRSTPTGVRSAVSGRGGEGARAPLRS